MPPLGTLSSSQTQNRWDIEQKSSLFIFSLCLFYPKCDVHSAELTQYLDKQWSETDTISYKPYPQRQKGKEYTYEKNIYIINIKQLFPNYM